MLDCCFKLITRTDCFGISLENLVVVFSHSGQSGPDAYAKLVNSKLYQSPFDRNVCGNIRFKRLPFHLFALWGRKHHRMVSLNSSSGPKLEKPGTSMRAQKPRSETAIRLQEENCARSVSHLFFVGKRAPVCRSSRALPSLRKNKIKQNKTKEENALYGAPSSYYTLRCSV